MKPKYYLKLARPQQWVKNTLVFAALIFANRITDTSVWIKAGSAFLAFSLVASAIYIFNDLLDRKNDIHHPVKMYRPIASGKVKVSQALIFAIILMVIGFAFGAININLLLTLCAYIVLQIFYNFLLKHKMLADVICIAVGFVLRAIAGAVAIPVGISEWLIICTFCLCLFLGFCKRYCEINMLDKITGVTHRKTLEGYTPELLTHLITLSATLAIVTFLLYSTSEQTLMKFNTNAFIFTLPVIIYCICRAAMQSMCGKYSGPTELILKDKSLLTGIILWIIMIVLIIIFADRIQLNF